jgi:hypothetical protein
MLKQGGQKLLFQLKQTKQDLKNLQELTFKQQKIINTEPYTKIKIKPLTTLTIRLASNNVFCTLKKDKQLLCVGSAGIYKIHISKRFLKSNAKLIIAKFFSKIKKKIRFISLLINLICPKKLKKKILRQILKFRKKQIKKQWKLLKKKRVAITIAIKCRPQKCFNGCRPSKKVRKKRRVFRITK